MKLSRARVIVNRDRVDARIINIPNNIDLEVEEFKIVTNSDRAEVVIFQKGEKSFDVGSLPLKSHQGERTNPRQLINSPSDVSPYPATPCSQQDQVNNQSSLVAGTTSENGGLQIKQNEELSEYQDDQSEDQSKDSESKRNLPQDLDIEEQEFFSKSLLSLIDTAKGDFLLSPENKNSAKLKAFVAASIYVISQSAAVKDLENMMEKSLVMQIPNLLEMTKPKRKDQKLRMIYNSIFKMLVNAKIKHSRQNFPSKFDTFLSDYKVEQREELKTMLVSSKAPSKKKLKVIFGRYPEIRAEFHKILDQQIFLKEYLSKRLSKSEQIYRKFHELYKQHPNDPMIISKILGSTFKAFPWSISEIQSSCDILFQITIECLVQAKKETSLENHLKSSLPTVLPVVALGKRSPEMPMSVPANPTSCGEIIVSEARYTRQLPPFNGCNKLSAFQVSSPPQSQGTGAQVVSGAKSVPPLTDRVRPGMQTTLESPSLPFAFVFLKDLNPYVPWKSHHLGH
jgi:hypothetical protein